MPACMQHVGYVGHVTLSTQFLLHCMPHRLYEQEKALGCVALNAEFEVERLMQAIKLVMGGKRIPCNLAQVRCFVGV